jgi:hypothetical protein
MHALLNMALITFGDCENKTSGQTQKYGQKMYNHEKKEMIIS